MHYTINDDDYAIVQKPKRKPQNVPRSNQAHNPMYGQVPRINWVSISVYTLSVHLSWRRKIMRMITVTFKHTMMFR
jgi:hypothetical protein